MILVDANLLLYAEDSLSARHDAARDWFASCTRRTRTSPGSPV